MKKCGFIILALVLSLALTGCSKKQQALEEMQQPMSPEDLNRLKTQGEGVNAAANITAAQSVAAPTAGTSVESLPPSGPFKPTEKQIQLALKNAGYYSGAIDGKIGPMSKRAVEEFQKANGLQPDGKVGPKTWAVLVKYLSPVQPTDNMQTGD